MIIGRANYKRQIINKLKRNEKKKIPIVIAQSIKRILFNNVDRMDAGKIKIQKRNKGPVATKRTRLTEKGSKSTPGEDSVDRYNNSGKKI